MLALKEYTTADIAEELDILKTVNNIRQCIKEKLKRYNIGFTVEGRGNKTTYIINSIPDPFELYCITELDYASNTDFKKLRVVLYLILNDEEVSALPYAAQAQRLADNGINISRGTISNYIKKLTKANFIGGGVIRYLLVKKDSNGRLIYEPLTEEKYKAGWKIYWDIRNDTGDFENAYYSMRAYLGGHPLKRRVLEENAFMLDEIEKLQELLMESYEKDLPADEKSIFNSTI